MNSCKSNRFFLVPRLADKHVNHFSQESPQNVKSFDKSNMDTEAWAKIPEGFLQR